MEMRQAQEPDLFGAMPLKPEVRRMAKSGRPMGRPPQMAKDRPLGRSTFSAEEIQMLCEELLCQTAAHMRACSDDEFLEELAWVLEDDISPNGISFQAACLMAGGDPEEVRARLLEEQNQRIAEIRARWKAGRMPDRFSLF